MATDPAIHPGKCCEAVGLSYQYINTILNGVAVADNKLKTVQKGVVVELVVNFSTSECVRLLKCLNESFTQCSDEVLRVKVFRVMKKYKQLKKHSYFKDIHKLEQELFEAPTLNVVNNNKSEPSDIKEAEKENKTLKRTLEEETNANINLQRQVSQLECKCDIILNLLHSVTQKHNESVQSSETKEKEIKYWETKYENLTQQLDKLLTQLSDSKEKLSKLSTRNVNKRIKRKHEKLLQLRSENIKLKNKIESSKATIEHNDSKVTELKGEKRKLQKKIVKLSLNKSPFITKCSDVLENETRIKNLLKDLKSSQEKIKRLEQINELLESDIVESFYDGKYCNEVRETIMTLITTYNVPLRQVNNVISVVLKNLCGKSMTRLPSAGVLSRLLAEAKFVAQKQVGEELLKSHTNTGGHCLHGDGTSKFHRHFQGFQITTEDGKNLSMGMMEVGGGSTAILMDALKDNVTEVSKTISATENNDQEINIKKLISTLKNTMSDQGPTNIPFNSQLQQLRSEILPFAVSNWDELEQNAKNDIEDMGNFFCKMHILVNFATEADKCLQLFEGSITEGRNPFSFNKKEAGAVRLARTVSKALTSHGCDKSGIASHFQTYMTHKGHKNKLITFRGHRFNHLFYSAAAVHHHLEDIQEFLATWPEPNELLKSVHFDVKEKVFVAGLKALGIIDKLITGPFWRLVEGSKSVLDMNEHLYQMVLVLQRWSNDASSAISGEPMFSEDVVDIHKDCLYDSLFNDANSDPVTETYTQMALELLCNGLLLIVERQAKDQLPGGKYWTPSPLLKTQAATVPATNTCSERDFAMLDVLMRLKPSEAQIMWSNNKTASWLNTLPELKRQQILDEARTGGADIVKFYKERKGKIFNQKLVLLQSRQEKQEKKETKQRIDTVIVTNKIADIGGVWTSDTDIDSFKARVNYNENEIIKAIISQIQFYHKVLHAKGERKLFQQTHLGHRYTLKELEENLRTILQLNSDLDSEDNGDSLAYKPLNESKDMHQINKCTLMKKIESGRRERLVKQQKDLLPRYLNSPELLVGKHIKHKCKTEGSNEVTWYPGKVLSVYKRNIIDSKKTEFNIKYDEDPDDTTWHFPLLSDWSKGDVLLASE